MESVVVWLVLAGIFGFLIFDTYWQGNREWVKSTVDGELYLVQSLPDKEAAADLLATIRQRLHTLVKHLEKTESGDERTERLVTKFQPHEISEGTDNSKYTSYSVNKGEKLVFCLRQKNADRTLVDINTLVFVATHELAHIATKSVGHTKEFWDNMRWLLEHAVNIGIYTEQDFKKPEPYCGVMITSSPLNNR